MARQGLGFRVQGLGFRPFKSCNLGVWGLAFKVGRIRNPGAVSVSRHSGLELRIWGFMI